MTARHAGGRVGEQRAVLLVGHGALELTEREGAAVLTVRRLGEDLGGDATVV